MAPRRRPYILGQLLILLAGLVTGCQEAGEFRMAFDWEGPPPANGSGIFVDVREVDPNAPLAPQIDTAPVLASAAPVPLGADGAEIELGTVPHGNGRVVIVQVRVSVDPASPLIRYGVSEVFSFQPGDNRDFTVLVPLRPFPAVEQGVDPIVVGGFGEDEDAFTRTPFVNLILQTDSGVQAEVSNFEAFPEGETDVIDLLLRDPLERCERGTGVAQPCRYQVSWDLNRGFDDDCGFNENSVYRRQDRCPRRVFVRFSDDFGFRSAVASRDIILDTKAPEVSPEGTSVNPPAAISDDSIQINVAFSEPVVQDGLLVEVTGSNAPLMRRSPPPDDLAPSSSFVYRIEQALAVGPDGSYPLNVAATDRAGNRLASSVSATVTVDNSVPVIRDPAITPEVIGGLVDTFELSFEVSEPILPENSSLEVQLLTEGAPLRLDPNDCLRTPAADDFIGWRCRRIVEASEVVGRQETPAIEIDLQDRAGNRSTDSSLSLGVDFRPPEIRSITVDAPVVAAGNVVRLTVSADEALAAAPDAVVPTFADGSLTCSLADARFQTSPQTRTFDCPTAGMMLTQDVEARLESVFLRDAVGNPNTVRPTLVPDLQTTVTIDPLPPEVTLSGDLPAVTVGSRLSVAFDLGEVPEALSVVVGTSPATCPTVTAPGRVVCHLDIPPSLGAPNAEVFEPVTIRALDLAGNVGAASGSVKIDRRGPGVLEASFARTNVGLGGEIILSVTLDEALQANPTLIWLGSDPGLQLDRREGQQYIFTRQVSSGSPRNGTYRLAAIRSTDTVNNTRTVSLSPVRSVSVDATAPGVAGLSVSPSRARAGSRITARFQLSNDTIRRQDLSVTVSGLALNCGTASSFAPGRTIVCTSAALTAPNPPTTTTEQVVVRATDAAGNLGQATESVVFDFEPPSLALATVTLLPDAANPNRQPTRVARSTAVEISISSSEPLATASPPRVVAFSGSNQASMPAVAGSVTAGGARFRILGSALPAQGTYTPRVTMTDEAGNVATIDAATVRFEADFVVVPVIDLPAISHVRAPQGLGRSLTLGGYFWSTGPYFAIAPADPLDAVSSLPASTFGASGEPIAMVRIWADTSRSTLLGTATPASGGWSRSSLVLAPTDTARAYVSVVDQAGNESFPRFVPNQWYIATSALPFGLTSPSPHEAYSRSLTGASLVEDAFTNAADAANLSTQNGWSDRIRSDHRWELRVVADAPSRDRSAVAFDPKRGRVLLFGGQARNTTHSDLWAYDGSTWSQVSTAGALRPSPRYDSAVAFDVERDRFLVFGGLDASGRELNDLWAFDGVRWTLLNANSLVRYIQGAKMTYDSRRREVLYWRGYSSSFDRGGIYRLTGSSFFIVRTGGSSDPGLRSEYAMAYDPVRNRVVIYGGRLGRTGSYQDNVIEINRSNNTYITPTSSGLGQTLPRSVPPALVFDSVRNEVLLSSPGRSTLMSWNGLRWAQRATGISTDTTQGRVAAFDTGRRVLILHGGRNSRFQTLPSANTFEWTGAALVNRTQADLGQPEGVTWHDMAYDSSRQVMVTFGGFTGGSNSNGLWEWNGRYWRSSSVSGGPPDSWGLAMASAGSSGILLVGGDRNTGTYTFNGTTWSRSRFGNLSLIWGKVAYDANLGDWYTAGGRSAAVGGSQVTGRRYTGLVWSTANANTPPSAGINYGLTYDSRRRALVFYQDGVLRERTSGAWTTRSASPSPSSRSEVAMDYNAAKGRTILFGGEDSSSAPFGDTWEWDGTRWRDVTPISGPSPSPRTLAVMKYDSARDKMVLFGGFDGSSKNDVWEFSYAESDRPSLEFRAQLPTDLSLFSVDRLRIRAFCGGSARGLNGASLYAWRTGGDAVVPGIWSFLRANSQGLASSQPYLPSTVAPIVYETSNPTIARALIEPTERRVYTQCRPRVSNGTGFGHVAADFFEVWVRQ